MIFDADINKPRYLKCSAPHVFLANFCYGRKGRLTARDVQLFREQCGPLVRKGEPPYLHFEPWQKQLLRAWHGRNPRDRARALFILRGGEELNDSEIRRSFEFNLHNGQLRVVPHDLWSYIRLLLMRDLKHAKICANPRCRHPYFIAGRSDGQFCSHACASEISVKRHRAEKRKQRRIEADLKLTSRERKLLQGKIRKAETFREQRRSNGK